MDWLYKSISVTSIITALGFLARYLIQKYIDYYFGQKLEYFKGEVNQVVEKHKYSLNKKMFDFEAYAVKKHSIYPELYKKLYIGWKEMHDYASAIESSSEEYYFDQVKKESITKNLLNLIEYFAEVELYLSKEVSGKSWKIIVSFQNYIFDLFDFPPNKIEIRQGNRDVFNTLKELKEQLHKELSYSHFEEEHI